MAKRREPDEHDPELEEEGEDLPEWGDSRDSDQDGAEEEEEEEEEEWPDPAIEAGPGPLNPAASRKVWITLGAVFAIIAIAVLYVYQAGDDKTILGNQPIPAALQEGGAGAAAGVQPNAGGAMFAAPGSAGAGLTAHCPYCGNDGLPMCSKCNTVMQPLGGNSGLYACPSCGTAGVPICPRCGSRMTPW